MSSILRSGISTDGKTTVQMSIEKNNLKKDDAHQWSEEEAAAFDLGRSLSAELARTGHRRYDRPRDALEIFTTKPKFSS
ncbi:hypothetical protein ROHU_023894 [Labeo rohita]|uniref:Uncharacterized protein n=1 Tax=Labeo rohita TaxID=84645 RepID=A0A498MQ53_LABRO|nr:hypothetical protein ROHU_033916 [Labeo rohita]RXN21762.1 hypothetical protein ROHU_023894 [Labeo rohita]